MGKFIDLTGQRIGKLTVLERELNYAEEHNLKPGAYWKCQCDCGNFKIVRGDDLNASKKANRNSSCGNCRAQMKDLTGMTFGKLTVLRLDEDYLTQRKGWKYKWICQCECGNIISVYGSNLTRLHTISCGCVNYSIGEKNIEQLLNNYNIKFIPQYSFEDLKSITKLRFDFAIFDKNNQLYELIEFDGRQHTNDYTPWNSKETLEERQHRDQIKNDYCNKNGIKLIRIPYTKRDSITLSLLELEEII